MKKDKPKETEDQTTHRVMSGMRILAYSALTCSMAIYFIWFVIWNNHLPSANTSDWANFGDFFGGTVGPFIGFASVVLLVETLKLQQRGLKAQQKQLQQSADEIKQQNRILMLQGFEQSFFSWLKDYKEQIDALSFHAEAEPGTGTPAAQLHGRHAMKEMINRCYVPFPFPSLFDATQARRLIDRSPDISEADIAYALEATTQAWGSLFKEHADWLGGLLRTLYGLFRWIDEHTQLLPEEKQHYASIVRARLSNAELRMLFINGMTPQGAKFAKYVNNYALFDNLPNPDLPVLEALKRHSQCPYTGNAYSTDVAAFMHFG